MTPHRNWFTTATYIPWHVPIRLADDTIIYSVGKGSVHFQPTGEVKRGVLISNVLHVPSLSNNLLSVLTLTSDHGFKVTIFGHKMSFYKGSILAITATVNHSKIAYLDGHVVTTMRTGSAHIALSTPPTCAFRTAAGIVDRPLMHRCLCHLGKDRLEQLIKQNLSSDLLLSQQSCMNRVVYRPRNFRTDDVDEWWVL